MPRISKTQFKAFGGCPRLLWHALHRPESLPLESAPSDAESSVALAMAREVHRLARQHYQGGEFPPSSPSPRTDPLDATRATRSLLQSGHTLYEAFLGCRWSGVLLHARADILRPTEDWEGVDILEVKAATGRGGAFRRHVDDIAFQALVARHAGLDVRRCILVFVDADYVRRGEVDPAALLHEVDETTLVQLAEEQIARRLDALLPVLSRPEPPPPLHGPDCRKLLCPLHEECLGPLPEQHVFLLRHGRKKLWDLYDQGVRALAEIPDDFPLNDQQRIQAGCARSGLPHLEREPLAAFLDSLEHPLSFFDLETFSTAVPLAEGLRPFQQTPFQFSLHVQDAPGAEPAHHEFLADWIGGPSDPRPVLLQALRQTLPETGSIVVYNATFERGRLEECARDFPEQAEWLTIHVLPRLMDLELPFALFWVHRPEQMGRTSIKYVLPAYTGSGYENLDVQSGLEASELFLQTWLPDGPAKDPEAARRRLLDYCGLDTLGMVRLVEALRALAREGTA